MPFAVNTSIRYTIVSILRLIDGFSFSMVFATVPSYVFGVIMYTEAILKDIMSIFDQIDQLSKSKDESTELSMLEYFKETHILHIHLNKYAVVFHFQNGHF